MAEYIEREALLDDIDVAMQNAGMGVIIGQTLRRYVKRQPTADVAEIRHGKWIETQEPLGWCDVDCAECSVCHESWIIDEDSSIDDYECMWHYCPHCGAKMDGGTNDDSKKKR